MEGLEPALIYAVLRACVEGPPSCDPFEGDEEQRALYVDALESYGVIEVRYGVAEHGENPRALYPVRLTSLGYDFLQLLQASARPERPRRFFKSH